MHSKSGHAASRRSHSAKERTDLKKFSALEFQAGDLPKNRIRDHLRQQIVSGVLLPGERIPPVRELAALWNTNIATIHFAFTELLRQGLIRRQHGHGTYVAERIRALHSAAIYFTPEMISNPLQWFGRSLWIETRNVLLERGVKPEAWMDQRIDADQVCGELEAAVQERRFQGVILLSSSYTPWMKNLSIPLSALSTSPLPFAVASDLDQFVDEGVRHLAEGGCRSVGTIAPLGKTENDSFRKAVAAAAARHGLETRNEWMRLPRGPMSAANFGSFGYEQFLALWKLPRRPDGLLVYPDRMVEGVILGIVELGVQSPRDVRLILHRNEGYPFIHPIPATYAVSRERDFAEALVRQLELQIVGEKSRHMLIPYHFVEEAGLPPEKR